VAAEVIAFTFRIAETPVKQKELLAARDPLTPDSVTCDSAVPGA
jgi:hypothetical protein